MEKQNENENNESFYTRFLNEPHNEIMRLIRETNEDGSRTFGSKHFIENILPKIMENVSLLETRIKGSIVTPLELKRTSEIRMDIESISWDSQHLLVENEKFLDDQIKVLIKICSSGWSKVHHVYSQHQTHWFNLAQSILEVLIPEKIKIFNEFFGMDPPHEPVVPFRHSILEKVARIAFYNAFVKLINFATNSSNITDEQKNLLMNARLEALHRQNQWQYAMGGENETDVRSHFDFMTNCVAQYKPI